MFKKEKNWMIQKEHYMWLSFLQSKMVLKFYNNEDNVILAQKQTER